MELRRLETLCAIVRTGSFSRAAEELYITQPAVSLHIRALEQELGTVLFERTGRSVRLTQSGELLHVYALHILRLAEEARQAIAEANSGERGRVVVGAGATTTIFTLPPVLQTMRDGHPGIEVILRSGTSREVAKMVRAGEVDLGLVTSPVGEGDLITRPLLEQKVLAVVGPGHRLAQVPVTTLREFATEPLILFVRGSGFRAYLDAIFAGGGVTPKVQMELDNVEAIKVLVETGLGASLVPEVAARAEVSDGRLIPLNISDLPQLSRSLSLIYDKGKYLSPAMMIFMDALKCISDEEQPQPE